MSTSLPFSVTDFPALTGADFEHAIIKAIHEANWQLDQLSENPEEPTFENTIVELERIQLKVTAAMQPFSLAVFDSRPDIMAAEEAIAEPVSRFFSALGQNAGVFRRIEAIVAVKDSLALSPDEAHLLHQVHTQFVRAGARLGPAEKQEVQDLQADIASAGVLFSKNVLGATQAPFVVTDKDELAGLGAGEVEAARALAASREISGYAFVLSMPNARSLMQESTHPGFREKVWQAYTRRGSEGEFDNHPLMRTILKKRARVAHIMGYPNWAAYTLDDMMAKTPENAVGLMTKVWDRVRGKFDLQVERLQADAAKDGVTLRPSDWFYYSEQLRKTDYAFDGSLMREYFPRTRVRDGLFDVTQKLFGLEYKPRTDIPGFAPDVDAYEVHRNHQHVGVLYIDDFQRDTKRGGAWMDVGRAQSNLDFPITPIVGNAVNLPRPAEGQEALLDMEEVVTMFHELGHGLHGLLSKVRFPSQSGTNVPADFVELPSQVMENWALEPAVMKAFAKNAAGETIPDEMIAAWQRSVHFDKVFDRAEALVSSFQDMRLHMLTEDDIDTLDFAAFEADLNAELGIPDLLKPRYNLPHFNHIFGWDYSARYYAYLWAAVLDADVFSKFQQGNLFDPDLARDLEHEIYAAGHSRPVTESFQAFMGREPDVEALLRREGFTEAPANDIPVPARKVSL
jgi:peptidyl-dipeptidase Dcp